jgi:hypothetical protein
VTAADTLQAWGILRAVDVVEIARTVGLDLACAAVLLEKESYGGHNVWGSDPVDPGGTYVKGAEVTRAAYEAYRAGRKAGRLSAQGVGPCQLTWQGYQDQADNLGGCWDWRANVRVGFLTLSSLQRAHGVREGFRRYNGDGPAAERYADDAVARLAKWRDRLGTHSVGIVPTPVPTEEDDMTDEERAALYAVRDSVPVLIEVRDMLRALKPGVALPGRSAFSRSPGPDDQYGQTLNAEANSADALAEVRAMRGELDHLATPQVDHRELAAELIAQLVAERTGS